ncbi:MAG: hypothetical protein IJJ40_05325 [Clostridia bacterium]|nr:hypothetical protein [Clostridia bacterium]
MGIFGNMFDFNNDGKLSAAKQGLEFAHLDRIINEDEETPENDLLELDEMFEDD